jgi:hypothetical protein
MTPNDPTPVDLSTPTSTPKPETPKPSPKDDLIAFQKDPVAFVRNEIDQAIKAHLLVANEGGQAQVAMQAFIQQHPDAQPVMNYILDEVARLIDSDDDGVLAPWTDLFNQALENVVTKFHGNLKSSTPTKAPKEPMNPVLEQGKLPTKSVSPRSFTRDEIGRMSPQEYLANEASIRLAFKEGRIK